MTNNERNPQQTKRKILRAALEEFCENGFDGARVDKIKDEAGVNKRMIYHYFGSKEGLFEAVFQNQILLLDQILDKAPNNSIREEAKHWMEHSDEIKGFLKLSSWIEFSDLDKLIHEKTDKTNHFKRAVAFFDEMQKDGLFSKEISPDLYLIGLMALISFPIVLPSLVKFITDKDPASSEFKTGYFKVVEEMTSHLKKS
ncbi:TetR/AcrR family transcriptional regulator [Candidatus Uabimicrobium amorphum]|uniref:TetR family transcriptional regulator n=1 Tax=Uabimicrobium amorphum TaxID=2596890 RepID=A0A5S9IK80_UABAM|nr:TetR/AcrR family transcriptional regulator [Candidatus Uabimicrobium amorphum]BBM83061.1 TetR family transcriptional regulator [Candidatus Uabimicrobium amorphum]